LNFLRIITKIKEKREKQKNIGAKPKTRWLHMPSNYEGAIERAFKRHHERWFLATKWRHTQRPNSAGVVHVSTTFF